MSEYDAKKDSFESYNVWVASQRAKLLRERCPAAKRVEVIGQCDLYLGDCREILTTLERVDSVVTDPPYGMNYRSGHATNALWGERRDIANDHNTLTRDGVIDWAISPNPRPCLFFGTWRIPRPSMTKMVLIWNKGGALGMGDLSIPWKPDHEEIYVLGSGFVGNRDSGSVIYCPPVQSMAKNGRVHPTEKPVDLMGQLIRKVPGVVLDPFMGSGSTGVACVKAGRRFIGIELDEGYFSISCERIRKAYLQPDMFVSAPKPEEPKQEAFL